MNRGLKSWHTTLRKCFSSRNPPLPPALSMDLSSARADVLFEIFSHLTARDAWNARLVSRGWNETSERSFQERCRAKRWNLPRRPRGGDQSTRFPFRRLYRANACARCVDGPGAFRVSKDIGRQHIRQFSLCGACVQDPGTVQRLRDWSLLVDFQSVEGKVLPGLELKKRGAKKRARAGGEAIDVGIRGFV